MQPIMTKFMSGCCCFEKGVGGGWMLDVGWEVGGGFRQARHETKWERSDFRIIIITKKINIKL